MLIVLLFVSSAVGADETVTNPMCPVLPDEKIDPDIHTDYQGKRVFFCCGMCKRKFLADPQKYLARLPQFAEPEASGQAATQSADHAHDHAADHDEATGLARLVRYLGKLHPISVHFPIALVLFAAVAELLLIRTGRSFYADAGRFCILAAAVTVVFTAALGWAAGAFAQYPGNLASVLLWHRWTGTAAGALVLLTGAIAMSPANSRRRLYRVLLFTCVLLITAVGFLGGSLVYGLDHWAW